MPITRATNLAGLGTVFDGSELRIGSSVDTGTENQLLQVTGGAYVSGSVGVGTTNPVSPLSVTATSPVLGQLRLTTGDDITTNGAVFLRLQDRNGNGGYFGFGGTPNLLDIWNYKTGDVRIGTNSVEVLRVTSNNNVGIATTNPITRFQVGSATSQSVFITSTGLVGFGSTAPRVSLDASQETDAIALPQGTTAQRPSGNAPYIRYNTTNSSLEFYDGTNWVDIIADYFPTGSVIIG